jgi:hypothetical protein
MHPETLYHMDDELLRYLETINFGILLPYVILCVVCAHQGNYGHNMPVGGYYGRRS